MEKLSNSDSEQVSEVQPSTFSVGPLHIQETPSLKKLFEDENGSAFVHIIEDKFYIHSHSNNGYTHQTLKKAIQYSKAIDEAFKEKGLTKLYTTGYTPEHDHYNEFLGYKPNGNIVEYENWDGPTVYEYEKDL
jgi:hypothetical protein